MWTTMRGADPDQLDDLARLFERSADRVERDLRASVELADRLHRSGADGTDLRGRLRLEMIPRVDQVTQLLRRQADRLRNDADDQRRVSGEPDTGTHPPEPPPRPAPRPRPPIIVLPPGLVVPSPPPDCHEPVVGGDRHVTAVDVTAIGSLTAITATFFGDAPWCEDGGPGSLAIEGDGTCGPEPMAVTAAPVVIAGDQLADDSTAPASPATGAPPAIAVAPPAPAPSPAVEAEAPPTAAVSATGPSRWPLAAALFVGAGAAAGVAGTAAFMARRPEPVPDPAVEAFFGPDPSRRGRP
jgi:hypothetical protein